MKRAMISLLVASLIGLYSVVPNFAFGQQPNGQTHAEKGRGRWPHQR